MTEEVTISEVIEDQNKLTENPDQMIAKSKSDTSMAHLEEIAEQLPEPPKSANYQRRSRVSDESVQQEVDSLFSIDRSRSSRNPYEKINHSEQDDVKPAAAPMMAKDSSGARENALKDAVTPEDEAKPAIGSSFQRNPLTGEGCKHYDFMHNKDKQTEQQQEIVRPPTKGKVPPGGHSQGLW